MLDVVTRCSSLLTLGQYISDTKTRSLSGRNTGSTLILILLHFLLSNSYFLGKREAVLDVKKVAER